MGIAGFSCYWMAQWCICLRCLSEKRICFLPAGNPDNNHSIHGSEGTRLPRHQNPSEIRGLMSGACNKSAE